MVSLTWNVGGNGGSDENLLNSAGTKELTYKTFDQMLSTLRFVNAP